MVAFVEISIVIDDLRFVKPFFLLLSHGFWHWNSSVPALFTFCPKIEATVNVTLDVNV